MLEIAKNSKRHLNMLIGFLTLTIHLWVIYTRHILLDFQHVANLLKDLRGKPSIAIRDHFVWQPYDWKDVLQVKLCNSKSIDLLLAG